MAGERKVINVIIDGKIVTQSQGGLTVHDLKTGDLRYMPTPPIAVDGALTRGGINYIAESAGVRIPESAETRASNNHGVSETVSKGPSALSRVVGTIVDILQAWREARQAREEERKAISAARDAIDDAKWQSDGEFAVKHGAPRSRLDPNNRPSEIRKGDEFRKKFWMGVVVVGTVVYCGYRLWKPGGDAGPVHPIDPAQPMYPPGTPTLIEPTWTPLPTPIIDTQPQREIRDGSIPPTQTPINPSYLPSCIAAGQNVGNPCYKTIFNPGQASSCFGPEGNNMGVYENNKLITLCSGDPSTITCENGQNPWGNTWGGTVFCPGNNKPDSSTFLGPDDAPQEQMRQPQGSTSTATPGIASGDQGQSHVWTTKELGNDTSLQSLMGNPHLWGCGPVDNNADPYPELLQRANALESSLPPRAGGFRGILQGVGEFLFGKPPDIVVMLARNKGAESDDLKLVAACPLGGGQDICYTGEGKGVPQLQIDGGTHMPIINKLPTEYVICQGDGEPKTDAQKGAPTVHPSLSRRSTKAARIRDYPDLLSARMRDNPRSHNPFPYSR